MANQPAYSLLTELKTLAPKAPVKDMRADAMKNMFKIKAKVVKPYRRKDGVMVQGYNRSR